MKKKLILALWALILLGNIFAVEGMIIPTIDYSTMDKWLNTLGETAPKLVLSKYAFKNQNFYLPIIFSDYELDKNKTSNLTYSIKIIAPNKKLYLSEKDLVLSNHKIENKNYAQMSANMIKTYFKEKDKYGIYKIEVEIKDKIAGKSKKLETEIEYKKLPSYKSFKVKDIDDFSMWMETYYIDPKPEKAVSYFVYYINSKLIEKDSAFFPIISFFMELIRNNQFLYGELLQAYKKESKQNGKIITYLLANL